MGNRPNINRKLRAKEGRKRWRQDSAAANPLYPRRNTRKDLLQRATAERIRLERGRLRETVFDDGVTGVDMRLEEAANITQFKDLPPVAKIRAAMLRGAFANHEYLCSQ